MMKSTWRVLAGGLALVLAGLGLVWTLSYQPPAAGTASRAAGGAVYLGSSESLPFTVTVSGPYTPTLSMAVRDLPDEPDLPTLEREPVRRDDHGFVGPDIQMPPHGNPLAELQASAAEAIPDGFTTPILNFAGIQDDSSPPDDTGDIGLNHYLQADNGPNGSRVTIYDKAGALVDQFDMEDLASSAPCTNGYCDPIVQYDELADRWFISEFDSSANTLCIYISATPDPTGQWWAYAFDPPGSMQDYPKYSVWADGYYMSANNGGYVIVMEREKMLDGLPATFQSFTIGLLPNFGFQLTMPATLEGQAPPAGSPTYYLRPRDTEIHGGTCTNCDLMEMWAMHVDWTTPANSTLTSLPGVQLSDWDQTLCGTGSDWSCMSQPGTTQKIDPIREPLHYPLQYRNFGTHEVLVGCFAEDVDGLDRAAVHWFELRRTPAGSGSWVNYQEGVLGDGVNDIHRSVCSVAMDSAGNIAVGYTRTGANAPYYPSIYYSGRLSSDALGTMPYYDNLIWDATTSKTDNERWGDYSGIGVDPADGCTFWYTTEYGGSGQTRIAAFKFDKCVTPDFVMDVTPDTQDVCVSQDAVYTVDIGVISEFSNTVTLTSTGTPTDTSASFVPNPLTPPGASVFTIGDTAGATPGSYDILVGAAASGSPGHQETVTLNLIGAAPAIPARLLPVDGTIGVITQPVFDWDDVAEVGSYAIEIATDPDFLTIVDSASGLSASTYTPASSLPSDTVLYWRVWANNACGSALSDLGAFRTAVSACLTYVSTDVPKTISDYTWATSEINVPDAFVITDVDVILNSVTHTYDGDLDIYIRHPDATDVELSTDNGGMGDNYTNTRFDDEASTSITDGTAPFSGSFSPEGTLATLDGKPAGGAWTLRIYDDSNSDTGTLNGWSLVLCGEMEDTSGDYSDLAPSYGVAWHTGDGALRLGSEWTADSAFAPPGIDDASDDGVIFYGDLIPGQSNIVQVNVQGTPANGMWLRLWFDWNGDGVFGSLADGELVYDGAPLSGYNDISVDVPAGAVTPVVYRARLYDSASQPLRDAASWGGAEGGEVEDKTAAALVCVDLTAVTISGEVSGVPGVYTFTTSYAPADASLPVTYLWDNGDTTDTSLRTLGEGTHTLSVTASNCTAAQVSDTHEIEIGVPPEAAFTSNTPIILGEQAVFTPSVTGTAPFEYLWDFGDGVTSTLEAPTHLYTAAGAYTVTLTVTSDWGMHTYTAEFVVNPLEWLTYLALISK